LERSHNQVALRGGGLIMALRYWVGGTATWDNLALLKWSLTSGGVGGQAVPTSADDVIFNSASGINTVTIATGAICGTLSTTGFRGTVAFGTNAIEVATTAAVTCFTGNSAYSVSGTPLVNITGNTSNTRTIAGGSSSDANSISFNISAGSGAISVSGTIRSLIFSGSYTGAYANTTHTICGDLTLKSGMTVDSGTSVRTFSSALRSQNITSAALNLNSPITFSGTTTYQLQDALAVGTTTSRTITLTTGTLDLNNFTLTHFGIFTSDNSNTRSIAFGSSGSIVNTRTGSATYWACGTISNFTRTGNPSVVFTGTNTTASTLTIQHGVTAGGTEDNSMSFVFGSSPTLSLSTSNWIYDLGSNNFTGNITGAATNTYDIYGSWIGVYTNYFGKLRFKSTKSVTKYLAYDSVYDIIIEPASNNTVFALQSSATYPNLYINRGKFTTNSYNLTAKIIDFNNTNTKTLTFNSIVSFEGTILACNFIGDLTNTTINLTGSIFNCGPTSSDVTLNVPNLTYDTVNVKNGGGGNSGSTIFNSSGSNQTVTNLNVTNNGDGSNTRLKIFAGTTLSVTNISIVGFSASTDISIASTTAGTQATLSKASGTVTASYATIKDNIATGGATWLAPTTAPYNNVNGGNNTGWSFAAISATNGNFLAFF